MGCLRGLVSILVIVLGLAAVGALFGGLPRTDRGSLTPPPGGSALQATPAKTVKPAKSYAERIAEAEATLGSFDFTSGLEDTDDVAASLAMLDFFSGVAAESPSGEADKALREGFTKKLRATQRRVLPVLRDKYGPALRARLWEADGKAKTVGQGYRTVELIAAAFAANRNIKTIYETLYPSLMRLRFTRAQFRWYDGADEYQYYTLKPPSDDDIVTWNGSSFSQVWPLPASRQ